LPDSVRAAETCGLLHRIAARIEPSIVLLIAFKTTRAPNLPKWPLAIERRFRGAYLRHRVFGPQDKRACFGRPLPKFMDGQYPGRYRSLGPLAGGGPKPGPMVGAAESLRRATAAGLKISLAPKAHHRVRTQSVRISATRVIMCCWRAKAAASPVLRQSPSPLPTRRPATCEMLCVCRKGQRRENVAGRRSARNSTRRRETLCECCKCALLLEPVNTPYFRSSLEPGRAVRNTWRNVALMLRALGYGHFEIL
jgi:hypothetical protein